MFTVDSELFLAPHNGINLFVLPVFLRSTQHIFDFAFAQLSIFGQLKGPSSHYVGIVPDNMVGMLWHSPQPATQFGGTRTIIMGAAAAPTSLSQPGPDFRAYLRQA